MLLIIEHREAKITSNYRRLSLRQFKLHSSDQLDPPKHKKFFYAINDRSACAKYVDNVLLESGKGWTNNYLYHTRSMVSTSPLISYYTREFMFFRECFLYTKTSLQEICEPVHIFCCQQYTLALTVIEGR